MKGNEQQGLYRKQKEERIVLGTVSALPSGSRVNDPVPAWTLVLLSSHDALSGQELMTRQGRIAYYPCHEMNREGRRDLSTRKLLVKLSGTIDSFHMVRVCS